MVLIFMMLNKIKQGDRNSDIGRSRAGFSLAEMLAALLIAAMVLVAVLRIYGRASDSAAAITGKLDKSQLGSEVLQRIAEDLDRIVTPDSDTKIRVKINLMKKVSQQLD